MFLTCILHFIMLPVQFLEIVGNKSETVGKWKLCFGMEATRKSRWIWKTELWEVLAMGNAEALRLLPFSIRARGDFRLPF